MLFQVRRSDSKESFSQVLFRALEFPEVKTDEDDNITMHQVPRLIYVDQITPVDFMYRAERFDSALIRRSIAEMLCGIYDDKLYRHRLALIEKRKQAEIAKENKKV